MHRSAHKPADSNRGSGILARKLALLAMSVLLCAALAILALQWTSGPPRLHRVTGTVTIGGKAAENVTVLFWPTSGHEKKQFLFNHGHGMTDASGRFLIKCGSGQEGIAAGTYKVTFSRRMVRGRPVVGDGKKAHWEGSVESIPPRFLEPDQSPAEATVSSKQTDFTFDITSN